MNAPPSSAAQPQSAPADPADLADGCAREPIHIPGTIQSYGHMLIIARDDLTVTGAAGTDPVWSHDALGRPMAEVLGETLAKVDVNQLTARPTVVGPLTHAGTTCDAVAYLTGAAVVVETWPQVAATALDARFMAQLLEFDSKMDRAVSSADLFNRAAQAIRDLTGYSRVLIYRFVDDEAGAVVGEARDEAMPGLMNHHFPASDIPAQARALYVRNRVRVIADVAAPPAPIRAADPAQAAALTSIDLSDSMIRGVSPVHIQYLRNMGVSASASMSLVRDGALWGLIACHHSQPRVLALSTRLACEAVAGSLARQIGLREETELFRARIRLRAQEDALLGRLPVDGDPAGLIARSGQMLTDLVAADGFAALQGDDLTLHGHCPPPAMVQQLAAFIRQPATLRPFASACLSRDFAPASACRDSASGLLAVTLSVERPTILMWFRAERLQTVTWAGNPHQDVPLVPGATLQPRASFQAWSEDVRGESADWSVPERESVARLARRLQEAINSHRLAEMNRTLTATIGENESLLRQKEFLIREVNHRVQNSLTLVASFLRMQGRDAPEAVRAQLDAAQLRLTAVSLVHRRLYQDDSAEMVDLSIYLGDLLDGLRATMDPAWADVLRSDLAPVQIVTDKAVSIGLLVNELVTNAAKYAYGGQPGQVAVILKQTRGGFRLEVADQGVGTDGFIKGTGFGGRMIEALVEQLEGQLSSEDRSPGHAVIVTAPTS